MRSGFRPWPPLQRTSEQTRSCPRIGLAAARFLGLVLENQVQEPGNRDEAKVAGVRECSPGHSEQP